MTDQDQRRQESASTPADIALASMLVKELVRAGASERSAEVFVELRGLGGFDPKSLRGVSRGLSAERIRQLVRDLENGPLRSVVGKLSDSSHELVRRLQALIEQIERVAPGSDAAVKAALAKDDVHVASPAGVIRLADTLGCFHGLRLTAWTSRAKFKDGEQTELAAYEDEPKRATVTGIVPAEMPEVFDTFINFARKFSRGAGVMAAGKLADRYSLDRGVPLTGVEAAAFLEPYAVHLGRHDGDEWFVFFNSANDFLRKAANRVALFGRCSFEALSTFHQRYNRSLYADEETAIPVSVLRASLELAGYQIDGDSVTPTAGRVTSGAGRGISEVQDRMVAIFRETLDKTGGRKSVPRATLVAAMMAAGIRESTAHIYLSNQGIFKCKKGLCRLADAAEDDEAVDSTPPAAFSGEPFAYPDA